MNNVDISRLSTGELLTLLQAAKAVQSEVTQQLNEVDFEGNEYKHWTAVERNLHEALDLIYDELGDRVLSVTGVRRN